MVRGHQPPDTRQTKQRTPQRLTPNRNKDTDRATDIKLVIMSSKLECRTKVCRAICPARRKHEHKFDVSPSASLFGVSLSGVGGLVFLTVSLCMSGVVVGVSARSVCASHTMLHCKSCGPYQADTEIHGQDHRTETHTRQRQTHRQRYRHQTYVHVFNVGIRNGSTLGYMPRAPSIRI